MVDEAAYRKFLSSAPTGQMEYRTVEIYHPSFGVLRFVRDYSDQQFAIESDAPRSAGEQVTFTAISMKINEPAEGENSSNQLLIQFGATSNQIEEKIKLISGEDHLTPIEVIYRKYYSGDLSEPVVVMKLSVTELSFEGYSSNSMSAEDVDFNQRRAGELYTFERFPGLV